MSASAKSLSKSRECFIDVHINIFVYNDRCPSLFAPSIVTKGKKSLIALTPSGTNLLDSGDVLDGDAPPDEGEDVNHSHFAQEADEVHLFSTFELA